MPQLDPSSFASQLFWLFITFSCLYFAMSRIALPNISRILQTRSDKISSDLKAAEDAKSKAQDVEYHYNILLKEAKEKSAALIAQTEATIKTNYQQQLQELDQELLLKAKKAEVNLQKTKQKLASELHNIESELVKLIISKLTNNKLDSKSISASNNQH